MVSAQQIEDSLIRGLQRLSAPYQQALQILRDENARMNGETNSGSVTTGSASTSICDRLRPSMELIAECEATVRPLRQQWNSLQKTPDGELKTLIDEQATVLKELIRLLNLVEQRFVNDRIQLGTSLDQAQRQNAARKAYQA